MSAPRLPIVGVTLLALGGCLPPRVVASLRPLAPPAAGADAPFRQAPPPLAPVVDPPLPVPEQFTLANGIRVVFAERHDVGAVSVRLLIPRHALAIDDPASIQLEQLAFLYRRGSELLIEQRLGQFPGSNASVQEWLGVEELQWAGHGAAEHLDLVAELVERRSFGATLTPAEYERHGEEWLQRVHLGGGAVLPMERFVLFGDRHPYGYGGWGRTLLAYPEALRLRAALLQPAGATLLVVGDVTSDRVHEVAQRWFGALSATAAPLSPASPPVEGPDFVASQLVYAPGAGLQQTCSLIGRGPVATPERAAALTVLAHLLRDPGLPLFEEVRGDLGATYGVSAGVRRQRAGTWMYVSGRYDRGREVDALAAELDLLRRIRSGATTDDELARAREAALGQWRGELATVDGMAGLYAGLIERGEDVATAAVEGRRLAAVGRDDLQAAAQVYLGADRLHVVITGVPTGLGEVRLGLGTAQQIPFRR